MASQHVVCYYKNDQTFLRIIDIGRCSLWKAVYKRLHVASAIVSYIMKCYVDSHAMSIGDCLCLALDSNIYKVFGLSLIKSVNF